MKIVTPTTTFILNFHNKGDKKCQTSKYVAIYHIWFDGNAHYLNTWKLDELIDTLKHTAGNGLYNKVERFNLYPRKSLVVHDHYVWNVRKDYAEYMNDKTGEIIFYLDASPTGEIYIAREYKRKYQRLLNEAMWRIANYHA